MQKIGKRMRLKGWMLLVACLSVLTPQAWGLGRIPDLYEIEIPVPNQGTEERHQALANALMTVLVKVSGKSNIGDLVQFDQHLAQAERFVQQYRYHSAAPASQDQLSLWVKFDQGAVDQLLKQNALSIWGDTRPTVIVWLAIDDSRERYILGGDVGYNQIRSQFEADAKRRGIPLIFPLLDLEDQTQVRFVDIRAGFADKLRAASKRYAPEAILWGFLQFNRNGTWTARWNMDDQQRVSQWSSDGSLSQSIGAGVDGITDLLAARYVEENTAQFSSTVRLHVAGVSKLDDFARLSDYVDGMRTAQASQLVQIEHDKITFEIEVRGDYAKLERELDNAGIVVPAEDVVPIDQIREQQEPGVSPGQATSPASRPQNSGTPVITAGMPGDDRIHLYYRLVP